MGNRKFHFGDKKNSFLDQIEKDVAFLRSQSIIDYSLLVGIHNTAAGREEQNFTKKSAAALSNLMATEEGPVQNLFNSISNMNIENTTDHEEETGSEIIDDKSSTPQDGDRSRTSSADGSPFSPSITHIEKRKSIDTEETKRRSWSMNQDDARPRTGSNSWKRRTIRVIPHTTNLTRSRSLMTKNDGRIESVGGEHSEVYFCGIIDTLIPYRLGKKAEHLAKSMIHKAVQLLR